MKDQLRRFAAVTAILWFAFGVGGPAEAGSILTTPMGLSPGEQFRFVFVTEGRGSDGREQHQHRLLQQFCEYPGGGGHVQRLDDPVDRDCIDGSHVSDQQYSWDTAGTSISPRRHRGNLVH